jgi:hypothetical protein
VQTTGMSVKELRDLVLRNCEHLLYVMLDCRGRG